MSQQPQRGRRSQIPWGLVGMLGLVLAVEHFIASHPLDFEMSDMGDWSRAARAARKLAPKCEILCFGDSMTKLGIQPRVLEPHLGRKVYNLAVASGSSTTSYYLLRRALDAGARPRAVLVDFHPHLLEMGPQWIRPYWRELLTTRECLELALAARDAHLFASTMTERIVPSARCRFEIRANILAALRDEDLRRPLRMLVYWRNWNRNSGAYVAAKNPEYRGQGGWEFAYLYPDRWPLNPVSMSYARRFLQLAAEHGIQVFWLIPPFAPEVEIRRAEKGLSEQFDRLVRSMQAEFPNIVVLDARQSGYDTPVFVDPIHLDRQGAATLSAEVAEILAQYLDPSHSLPRWVKLPPYRDRSTEVALEDGWDSLYALQAKDGKVRR
ncbi:MAG: hypothetical protein IRY99_04350 [Isosphaeraceae bacterium]|nr:hypothetical protein [Isosphaeraceae bacterium]